MIWEAVRPWAGTGRVLAWLGRGGGAMKYLRVWLQVGCVAVLAGCAGSGVAAEAMAPGKLIEVLDAAIGQWRSGAELRCRYTFRQGFATSKEAALKGEFGSRVGKPNEEDRATGVFCKLGQRMRMSAEYSRSPDVVQQANWGVTVSNISFDETSTADLFLSYTLPAGSDPGRVAILRRPETDHGLEVAGPVSRGVLNPFSFGGGEAGSLSRMYAPRLEFAEQVEFLPAPADANHLAITIARTSPGRHRLVARVAFWQGAAPAVISKIEEDLDATPAGGRRTERVVVGSEFVQCGRAMMARVVRSAAGPMQLPGENAPQWLAKEWVSDDLGSRLPTAEDFVVTIAKDAAIVGLRDPPPPGTVRRLDLSAIRLEDVANPREAVFDEALAFPGTPSAPLLVGGLARGGTHYRGRIGGALALAARAAEVGAGGDGR